ncbi:MAG TPA: hypothetical protein VH833_06525 [Gemmatimonadales bacterium]
MKAGFWQLVRAAFNARPFGMLVPPNWIGVAAVGLLGLVNPGFWVIGAGVELGYLSLLVSNQRFRRAIGTRREAGKERDWEGKVDELLARLSEPDRRRYAALAARCRTILAHPAGDAPVPGALSQDESLSRLVWLYLKLLLARQLIARVLSPDANPSSGDIDRQIADLQARLKQTELTAELRRSLTGQLEILTQRRAQRVEAKEKLAYLDAECTRIEQQVELLREQAALSADPEVLSRRIDDVTGTLGSTAQWVREQQQLYGAAEDMLSEPPPLAVQARVRVGERR